MARFTEAFTARFTEEEAELVRFWADQSGEKPAEWIRSKGIKALHATGPSEIQIVLAEICGMVNLQAEIMVEVLTSVMSGDEDAAIKRAEKLFDKAMKTRHEEAVRLLSKKEVIDPDQGAVIEANQGGVHGTD